MEEFLKGKKSKKIKNIDCDEDSDNYDTQKEKQKLNKTKAKTGYLIKGENYEDEESEKADEKSEEESESAIEEKKVKNAKTNRVWNKISQVLNDRNFANEVEDDERLNKNIGKGIKKFEKKLRSKWDEHGTEFTAFNMKEEMEEGDLDKEGFYLRKKVKRDEWYESVREEIEQKEYDKKMKELEDKKKKGGVESDSESVVSDSRKMHTSRKRDEEVDSGKADNSSDEDAGLYYKEEQLSKAELNSIKDKIKELRFKLLDILHKNETVQQAIARFKTANNAIVNIQKNFQKNRRKMQKTEESKDVNMKEEVLTVEQISTNKKKFEEILEIVSKLTELSFFNVYSDSVKSIEKDYEEELNKQNWFYKTEMLVGENSDATEYGPFDKQQIKEWVDNNLLTDTQEIKILFQVRGRNIEPSDWFGLKSTDYREYIY